PKASISVDPNTSRTLHDQAIRRERRACRNYPDPEQRQGKQWLAARTLVRSPQATRATLGNRSTHGARLAVPANRLGAERALPKRFQTAYKKRPLRSFPMGA